MVGSRFKVSELSIYPIRLYKHSAAHLAIPPPAKQSPMCDPGIQSLLPKKLQVCACHMMQRICPFPIAHHAFEVSDVIMAKDVILARFVEVFVRLRVEDVSQASEFGKLGKRGGRWPCDRGEEQYAYPAPAHVGRPFRPARLSGAKCGLWQHGDSQARDFRREVWDRSIPSTRGFRSDASCSQLESSAALNLSQTCRRAQ